MMDAKHAGMLALVLSLVVFFAVAVIALTAGKNTYGTVAVLPGGPYLTLGGATATTASSTSTSSTTATTSSASSTSSTTAPSAPSAPTAAPTAPQPSSSSSPATTTVQTSSSGPTVTSSGLTPLPASAFHLCEDSLDSGMGFMLTI